MSAFSIPPPVHPSGLFWFVAKDRKPSHFVWCTTNRARPTPGLEEVAWRLLQHVHPQLHPYAFDFYPRGAVWRCNSRHLWIVELDPKLARGAFIAHLVVNWPLPPTRIVVHPDRNYASFARVGPPAVGGLFCHHK
ncbi:MAG: hypothetical protein K2Z80_25700 [Xanthobacteraceae bacterium]|nr:hypothetical protein [Xanthobacteraceae bacterium]